MKRFSFIKLGIFFSHIYYINLSSNPNNNNEGGGKDVYIYRKTTRDMLFDSLLVGGIVFIASLPSTGIPTVTNLFASLHGFLYYFLAQLIVDRVTTGLAKQVKKAESEKK